MADQSGSKSRMPDPHRLSQTMADIAERSHRLVMDFLTRQISLTGFNALDPLNVGGAFFEMTARMMANPAGLVRAQMSLWRDYLNLWQSATSRMILGPDAEPAAAPDRHDRRFKDSAWSENEVFDFIKQSYLLTARWIQATVNSVGGLDPKTAQKIDFVTHQFVDALSPSNFLLTNPEVLRATIESGGENLVNGLKNLLEDLEHGDGKLNIRMTDLEAFKVGSNVATTPGKVVYRNDLMELIQYEPTTEKVHEVPLLILPPWINKYYILDLRRENSLIKWIVDQGHTVFVISWVNPDEKLASKTFEDYMLEGPIDALKAIRLATGTNRVNLVGYCIGGTLLACVLSYLEATKKNAKDVPAASSATFLATMVDFKEPGDLGVFIDEEQLTQLERKMDRRGYLEGREMASTFNTLRSNDLIWSFVVNNYLLGKEPFPFDLLYWNSDSTRMPAAMHSFYLRKMYLENLMVQPGGIRLAGVPIDLRRIGVPVYIASTREDHIAPWKSAYAATQIYNGPVRFVLTASGHIAGIINPPEANKYHFCINDKDPKNPDEWLKGARQVPGSWWPDWAAWLKKYAGKSVSARKPGAGKLKALCAAPGTYVNMRADDSRGAS